MILDDRDLRLNQPVVLEELYGEVLYRQVRERPLTADPVGQQDFSAHNGPARQMWTDRLTAEEAAAVQTYRDRWSRWMDVYLSDAPRVADQLGIALAESVGAMVRHFSSAASKSFTGRMVLRHYARASPGTFDGHASRNGRVCISGSFISCSTRDEPGEGYGRTEIRIVTMPGAGNGVFVTPPGDPHPEFVLPPGTAFRAFGNGRREFCLEQVRRLSTGWNDIRMPGGHPDEKAAEYNEHLLRECRTEQMPIGICPPATEGW